ncbi:MAG: hypothetical protein LBD48_09375, partial [Treponema sp.]|nr:hypothetical protein [Treponema sp.]
HEDVARINAEPPQQGLWEEDSGFEEEDVEPEEGRELPIGIDDPGKVSEAQLRPIRANSPRTRPADGEAVPAEESAPAPEETADSPAGEPQ